MSNQTFDFSEALRRMKEGKVVRIKDDWCLYTIYGGNIIMGEDGKPKDDWNVCSFPFNSHEILATDWEEVEK